VIRRHPDIKWRRGPDDINKFVPTQTELINALWKLLKNEGILLYATCSILPQENRELILRFMAEHDNARLHPLNVGMSQVDHTPWSLSNGWQILPGEMNMDGFYYAALHKVD
jgi:16S rRNA (cytosine967-C5)-methyltransferase